MADNRRCLLFPVFEKTDDDLYRRDQQDRQYGKNRNIGCPKLNTGRHSDYAAI
jgi:hypothetical protein